MKFFTLWYAAFVIPPEFVSNKMHKIGDLARVVEECNLSEIIVHI
jgi:hypothetical protein